MATADEDALLLLRQAIASGGAIIPSASAEPSANAAETPIMEATHLHFTLPAPIALPIDTATRFYSGGGNQQLVDLRSIYFAWLNRDVAIPEYIASANKLNDEAGGAATVLKLAFVERVDLITWLEGASEESEYIKPLAGEKDAAAGAASATAAKGAAAPSASRPGRGALDPRLAQIYSGERRMGDRNSVLRGIKPTDFSHVRKLAAPFMSRKPQQSTSIANNPSLALNQKRQRRPDPIILLSSSPSSLLRLSNVKSFLESGRYTPPDNTSTASMLHISRIMKEIDPGRPMRFILVEGPEQFKPEYWERVVAVFTTGQAWQFKNYRWSNPTELFKHVLGVYVGWRGDPPPDTVKQYGHRILQTNVDKWRDPAVAGTDTNRWRDREVVENVWKAIESNMRSKGWKKDAAPVSI